MFVPISTHVYELGSSCNMQAGYPRSRKRSFLHVDRWVDVGVIRRLRSTRLVLIEYPYTVCQRLVGLLADLGSKTLEDWGLLGASEELALPLASTCLFLLTHLALTVFNDGFLGAGSVHVTLHDSIRNLLPCATRFEVVLLSDWSNSKRCGFGGAGVVRRESGLVLSVLDGPFVDPLALSGVDDILLLSSRVERR